MLPRFPLATFLVTLTLAPCLGAKDFDKDVKPILKEHCYECHSEEAKKEKAGFVFDNKTRLKKDIGPNLIIEPGDPASSHFLEVIANPDAKNHMPPNKNLSSKDIATLREWISVGAPLDKDAPKVAAKKELPPIMSWTNAEGRKIRAGFGGIEGENVIFKMPNGQRISYPIANLAPESQAQAREAAAP
ncbi:cytochrome c [Roseimicrobium gellanilyticum]|uniref:Cytochrome c n=1 Tax=Roseimicrobium gellanilyticum TaxID=748857 RepID=A0A366HMG7_9BACT|nr:c-type cytochrome domain-containing protein [Roseimicrobium gellanilyticum]RBP44273.1 cytochrome c [Roseimicrobium gellanilyticum]